MGNIRRVLHGIAGFLVCQHKQTDKHLQGVRGAVPDTSEAGESSGVDATSGNPTPRSRQPIGETMGGSSHSANPNGSSERTERTEEWKKPVKVQARRGLHDPCVYVEIAENVLEFMNNWTTTPYEPRKKSTVELAIEWFYKRNIESFRKDHKRCALVIVFKDATVEHLPESWLKDIVQNYSADITRLEKEKAEKHMAIISGGGAGGGGIGYATLSYSSPSAGHPEWITKPFYGKGLVNQETPKLTAEEKKQKNKYSNPRL